LRESAHTVLDNRAADNERRVDLRGTRVAA
jgi:hypothetical protein